MVVITRVPPVRALSVTGVLPKPITPSVTSTTFKDSSTYLRTITAHGNVKVSNAGAKFGASSALFDGVNSYLTMADAPELQFQGNWTIDFWINIQADGITDIFGKYNAAGITPVGIRLNNDLRFHWYFSTNGTTFNVANGTAFGAFTLNTWNHIVIQRNNANTASFTVYVNDGILQNFASSALPFSGTDTVAIGARLISGVATNFFNGYIDEFHWVDQLLYNQISIALPLVPWTQPSIQGNYTVPDSHVFNAGRVAPITVQVDWTSPASALVTDFFAIADYFNQTDIFGTTTPGLTDVHPEVNLSTDGLNFLGWQRYRPGIYNAWKVKVRMNLQAFDANVAAGLSTMSITAYLPTRTDNLLINANIPNTGTTFTFTPDGGSPAPFNGGPNSAVLPVVNVTINNATSGDTVILSGLTLSQVTVVVQNGGVGVARNCTVTATGY